MEKMFNGGNKSMLMEKFFNGKKFPDGNFDIFLHNLSIDNSVQMDYCIKDVFCKSYLNIVYCSIVAKYDWYSTLTANL